MNEPLCVCLCLLRQTPRGSQQYNGSDISVIIQIIMLMTQNFILLAIMCDHEYILIFLIIILFIKHFIISN